MGLLSQALLTHSAKATSIADAHIHYDNPHYIIDVWQVLILYCLPNNVCVLCLSNYSVDMGKNSEQVGCLGCINKSASPL